MKNQKIPYRHSFKSSDTLLSKILSSYFSHLTTDNSMPDFHTTSKNGINFIMYRKNNKIIVSVTAFLKTDMLYIQEEHEYRDLSYVDACSLLMNSKTRMLIEDNRLF